MKARASKQEAVCDRKQRLLKDEQLLKQKLINYEREGLDFYTDRDEAQKYHQEEPAAEEKPYQENPYQLMLRWIMTEV